MVRSDDRVTERGSMRLRSPPITSPRPARRHAAAVGEPLPEHIERQLRMLSAVLEETKAADKQLQTLAAEHAVCRRLMTVPGGTPDGRAVCRNDRRAWSGFPARTGAVVSRPHAERALELGARAAHRDHQGGSGGAGRDGGDRQRQLTSFGRIRPAGFPPSDSLRNLPCSNSAPTFTSLPGLPPLVNSH